jgi:hypothetical protein
MAIPKNYSIKYVPSKTSSFTIQEISFEFAVSWANCLHIIHGTKHHQGHQPIKGKSEEIK